MVTKQPNSRLCFVCGLESSHGLRMSFYNASAEEVRAEVTVPAHYQGYPGVVHGGIVAAMLDETCGRTSMLDDPNHFMLTVKLEVKYRVPVPTEVVLVLTGRRLKARGRLATAHAALRLPDGTLAAEADATLADVPASMSNGLPPVEQLGWRVYEG